SFHHEARQMRYRSRLLLDFFGLALLSLSTLIVFQSWSAVTQAAPSPGDCVNLGSPNVIVTKLTDPNNKCFITGDCYTYVPCPTGGFTDTTVPIKNGVCTDPTGTNCKYCPTSPQGQSIKMLCGYSRSWTGADCTGTFTPTPIYSRFDNACIL